VPIAKGDFLLPHPTKTPNTSSRLLWEAVGQFDSPLSGDKMLGRHYVCFEPPRCHLLLFPRSKTPLSWFPSILSSVLLGDARLLPTLQSLTDPNQKIIDAHEKGLLPPIMTLCYRPQPTISSTPTWTAGPSNNYFDKIIILLSNSLFEEFAGSRHFFRSVPAGRMVSQ